jgi:hypothetical protein
MKTFKQFVTEELNLTEASTVERSLKTTTFKPYSSHKGFEVSSKKIKTPKHYEDRYGDYHIYHGTIKNKNGSTGKEKKFVVHDRPLDVKFMHRHSDDEKDAILHHLNKNKHLDKSQFNSAQIPEEVELIDEKSPAWQRAAGKDPEGGLNRKGIASYRRENPGSKLSMAVTTKPSKLKPGSKAANRRKSFCARMGGMKKRLTSAKTANDPDSRINKALRKWNC